MKCHVVKDLLPLYVDGVTGEETGQDIAAHLEGCPQCSALHKQLSAPLPAAALPESEKEVKYLKKLKARAVKTAAAAMAALLLVFGILAWVFIVGAPVSSEEVITTMGFQTSDNVYQLLITFTLTNGKALNAKTTYLTRQNAAGQEVGAGCIITLYAVQPSSLGFEDNAYSWGYIMQTPATLSSGYTISIRYRNKEESYILRPDGLFAA